MEGGEEVDEVVEAEQVAVLVCALRPGTSMCDVDVAGQRDGLGEVDHADERRGVIVDEEERRPDELMCLEEW